ncbi:MAG: radical SAM protein [Halioglobus sp.]|nr:radical SAM protein [Halioglobus sp.]
MSKIAIVKIHPGLNMALPQLAGDLVRAGHFARMFFFKDYLMERDYGASSFSDDRTQLLVKEKYAEFPKEYESLAEKIAEFKPHAIGLSVISLSIAEAIKTTAFLRSKFDLPIVWGGVGTTLEPEIAIEHADLVCVGEGEEVMVEFANHIDGCLDWRKNTDWLSIEGTWSRAPDGTVTKNPKRAMSDLNSIAIPDWNASKMVYINGDTVRRGPMAHGKLTQGDYQIMTQRGCPFSCSFCVESRYQEMFGKKNSLRRRSVDVVIEELVIAKETHSPAVVWFWDDVFTVNPRWLREFLPRYKEEVGLPFWCYTYPTTHTLDLLKDLKEGGCASITMGIQSGSERILKESYNRPTPLGRVIEASQEIVDSGLNGYFDLITKSSFETEEDLRATFEFLVNLPGEMIYLGAAEMKSYPTYAYTINESISNSDNILTSNFQVTDAVYDYYHELYWVARNPHISKQEKLDIGNEPVFRANPKLLREYTFARPDEFEEGFRQMREGMIAGKHPHELFPPGEYKHTPIAHHITAMANASGS